MEYFEKGKNQYTTLLTQVIRNRDKVNAGKNVHFMFFSSILHVSLAFKNDCEQFLKEPYTFNVSRINLVVLNCEFCLIKIV